MNFNPPPIQDGWNDSSTKGPKPAWALWFENMWRRSSTAGQQVFPISVSVANNALSVTLNPCTLNFRSATLPDGTIKSVQVENPITLTVPNGATLGMVGSAVGSEIKVLALYDGTTAHVAVVNVAQGFFLDETALISSVAISTGANSTNVVYSDSLMVNMPLRVVGTFNIAELVAGVWALGPSKVQGIGGSGILLPSVPSFSAYPSTPVSLTQNVATKVACDAVEWNNFSGFGYDTANKRFQPAVAGYYQFNANVQLATTAATAQAFIYKNGSPFKIGPNAPTQNAGGISCLVYMNGVSDFAELYCTQSAPTQNCLAGPLYTYFQGSLVHRV